MTEKRLCLKCSAEIPADKPAFYKYCDACFVPKPKAAPKPAEPTVNPAPKPKELEQLSVETAADLAILTTAELYAKRKPMLDGLGVSPDFFNTLFGCVFIQQCKEKNMETMRK